MSICKSMNIINQGLQSHLMIMSWMILIVFCHMESYSFHDEIYVKMCLDGFKDMNLFYRKNV